MALILTFSRAKIADYLACQRRFQLRYLQQQVWPVAPLPGREEEARQLGQRFHQRLQRHYLGLPVTDPANLDPQLRVWWQRFLDEGPGLPGGRLFTELSLTIPVGRHQLTGRFDLLVIGDEGAHIFDWKSDTHPRSATALKQDLQTSLYQVLAVEGCHALSRPIAPNQLQLTYWYASDPMATVTFRYNQERHDQNWTFLLEVVAGIDYQLTNSDPWKMTQDLTHCERCAYQVLCERRMTGQDLSSWESEDLPAQLEPDYP